MKHNMAAYCPDCYRVQCRCKQKRARDRGQGSYRTMEQYHDRFTSHEAGEPSQEEKDRIDLEAAIMLIDKIAAGPQDEAPQGERLGKLALSTPQGHRMGRAGARVY